MSSAEVIPKVDGSFRPSIKRFLKSRGSRYADSWGISNTGISVPTEFPGRSAAVWIGQRTSANQETPVLAVSVENGRRLSFLDRSWFVGVFATESFGRIRPYSMPEEVRTELACAAIDAAQHGPGSFEEAIDLLENLAPVNQIRA